MGFDPVTGPFSRQQIRDMAAMPYGAAKKAIQKVDPLYGREPGEKIKWRVTASARLSGVAFVEAVDFKEANKLADDLGEHDFDWGGYGCDNLDVLNVEMETE